MLVQRKPHGNGLPEPLKTNLENQSGYDLSDVTVYKNSEMPAQLMAHAYAQGNEIHLAPGQEKHLPHEAWHVVQQKQGRVRETMQMKGIGVNDDVGLEKEADLMSMKAQRSPQPNGLGQLKKPTTGSKAVQRIKTVIVGEEHDQPKIMVKRLASNININFMPFGRSFSLTEKGWKKKATPSMIAAALIQQNGFVPPTSYKTILIRQMKDKDEIKKTMEIAERISMGKDSRWGTENGLLKKENGLSLIISNDLKSPGYKRTHIEDSKIRSDAAFLMNLSLINRYEFTPEDLISYYPNRSGIEILMRMDSGSYRDMTRSLNSGNVSERIREKWNELKGKNGLLGQVVPKAIGSERLKEYTPSKFFKREKEIWAAKTASNIKNGLKELYETAKKELKQNLGDDFKSPLEGQIGEELINMISDRNLKNQNGEESYEELEETMRKLRALASTSRTLSQLKGIAEYNRVFEEGYKKRYRKKNKREFKENKKKPLKTGYIVGDNHVEDVKAIKNSTPNDGPLKSLIDNSTLVSLSQYVNLRKDMKEAVTEAGRTKTFKVNPGMDENEALGYEMGDWGGNPL